MLSIFKKLFQKTNEGAVQAIENGAVIIDVRTRQEFKQGHIAGSKNIPLNEIRLQTEAIRKWNKPIVTVCFSGSRSAAAKGILRSAGIEAYNGGSWTSHRKKNL
jgi:rhodanese-related sulfurtransferase